ncbi:MAG: phosphate acyltransferase PlsX [Planctomycetota bacterium]
MPLIAIDAMGGDNVPSVPVQGAFRALENNPDLKIILVGPEDQVMPAIDSCGGLNDRVQFVHAPEWVTMEESPVEALRNKPASSLASIVMMQKERTVEGIFSAGNTGAFVAACSVHLRMHDGVRRPAIALPMPRGEKPIILCDGGANVESRPQHLLHNAAMSATFLTSVYGIESPRIGLLNVGSEADKGHTLAKETFELLTASGLNFCGNVEGNDLFNTTVDVIVCDGFTGNVVLKSSEGLSEFIFSTIARELSGDSVGGFDLGPLKEMIGAGLKSIASRFDYAEYGGAPLLGPKGICTIGHGKSDEKAICNAITWTCKMIESRFEEEMVRAIGTVNENVESTDHSSEKQA